MTTFAWWPFARRHDTTPSREAADKAFMAKRREHRELVQQRALVEQLTARLENHYTANHMAERFAAALELKESN